MRVLDGQTPVTPTRPSDAKGYESVPTLRLVESHPEVSPDDAKRDVDVVLWSMKLCSIRRYFHQRFWESETEDAEYAEKVEPMPRLETVAEHSWHVADTVLLLADHFPDLDPVHCAQLAILHDKMEISIGDYNPVGRDGTGRSTHAFNAQKKLGKAATERAAINHYLSRLRPAARKRQSDALFELLEGATREARFVKAVDKFQAFAFVLVKKRGELSDKHLEFTMQYSEKIIFYFPRLARHYFELRSRLLLQVARRRNCSVKSIEQWLRNQQLPLGFGGSQDGSEG
jgi:5'-deoxynucleotidase YfbR-like HD superfamily hydrolase